MRIIPKIYFFEDCDRANCTLKPHHAHWPEGELKPEFTNYRRRTNSFYLDQGGRYTPLMTVQELMLRLLQLPQDAIVAHEEHDLYVIDKTDETVYTVASAFEPNTETFDKQHLLITGESR